MIVLEGAQVDKLRRQIRRALPVIDMCVRASTGHEPTLTHGRDGRHMKGSLHYKNRAVDIDWPPWTGRPEKVGLIAAQLRLFLGYDYDVVVEATHLHVEYDPK